MARKNTLKTQPINGFSLLISGLGLGWLVGLSVSPVIQVILTSLVAIVVSLSGAFAGLSGSIPLEGDLNKRRIPLPLDPLPIMLMVVGLAVGASAGVYARTNNWFGARTNHYVREWADTGYSKAEITRRVFDNLYPPVLAGLHPVQNPNQEKKGEAKKETTSSSFAEQAGTPVLYETPLAAECQRLRQALDGTEDELRREIASAKTQQIHDLTRNCPSDDCLKNGVKKLCQNP